MGESGRLLRMRHRRIIQTGARYHVFSRANRKDGIFESIAMKEIFLQVIRQAKRKYRFSIENFCIMGTHFHFIIRPEVNESLSDIMRWILGVFAMRYNRETGLDGHVWQGRFHSRIIASRADFLRTFDYVSQNPVKAGLVGDAGNWLYGGIAHYGEKRFDILNEPLAWLDALFRQWRFVCHA